MRRVTCIRDALLLILYWGLVRENHKEWRVLARQGCRSLRGVGS